MNAAPKPAALIAVRGLREVRRCKLHLQLERERRRGDGEALRVAVEMIADRDRQIAAVSRQRDDFRAQLRALMSGRTVAEERQAVEQDLDEGRAA